MKDLSSIGKNIREKRKLKSWGQEELAEKTNLSVTYIGMIERGERIPAMETFISIANALDATADELLEGVINKGYEIRLSMYAEELGKKSKKEQEMALNVLKALLGK